MKARPPTPSLRTTDTKRKGPCQTAAPRARYRINPSLFFMTDTSCGQPLSTVPTAQGEPCQEHAFSLPDTIGLYSERFHGLLTLFSECFSTFPHGTCSLSVLWKYLALDRVYDLLSAAFSNNATLGERPCPYDFAHSHTGLTPSMETIPPLVGIEHSWLLSAAWSKG